MEVRDNLRTNRSLQTPVLKLYSSIKTFSMAIFSVSVLEIFYLIIGPIGNPGGGGNVSDILFLSLIAVHLFWGVSLITNRRKNLFFFILQIPEILFITTLVLFIFYYTYALNANMDYVQRFQVTSGNLSLAPDSTLERANALMRFLPFLLLNGTALAYFRSKRKILALTFNGMESFTGRWALPLSLLSSMLYTLSFPSFISLKGFSELAWVSLVPLLLVIKNTNYRRAVFYGVSFGVIHTMLTNYWLGTFSLISLQFITGYYLLIYTLFMLPTIWIYKQAGRLRFLVFPAAMVVFDYLRSYGFMGYPWSMLGVSQYDFIPLIQIASLTGVWGVTFIVTLCNSVVVEVLDHFLRPLKKEGKPMLPIALFFILFVFSIIHGYSTISQEESKSTDRTVRIVLIQQNTDPRKHDYQIGLNRLTRLTDQALKESPDPDLVVWSETAFVPNIRRWSKYDPEEHHLARLVHDFLRYQKERRIWLVTGNDDYLITQDEDGKEIRLDYNASVFFSDEGERLETYHKVHLVPFTEYFPFKEELPWLHELLLNFDVNLWEPGDKRTVFNHPLFSFSTPICFEDSFPGEVREFVLAGADMIINLSNDFWSLTETEAKQHFINAKFRALETRRPLLRATASGLTSYVDTTGTLKADAPYYEESFIVVDVPLKEHTNTLYLKWGDWFPLMLGLALGILSLLYFIRWIIGPVEKGANIPYR